MLLGIKASRNAYLCSVFVALLIICIAISSFFQKEKAVEAVRAYGAV
jgi:hypothetical protein